MLSDLCLGDTWTLNTTSYARKNILGRAIISYSLGSYLIPLGCTLFDCLYNYLHTSYVSNTVSNLPTLAISLIFLLSFSFFFAFFNNSPLFSATLALHIKIEISHVLVLQRHLIENSLLLFS